MKKTIIMIVAMLLLFPSLSFRCENLFYYTGDEKNVLVPLPTKRAIYNPAVTLTNDNNDVMRIGARVRIWNQPDKSNPDETQGRIRKCEGGELSLPIFLVNNEIEVVMLPEILVRTKVATYDMSSMCHKYNLKLVKNTHLYQKYSIPADSDVINIANEIYESGDFDFAYPNLFCPAELHAYIPNDPYFQYQITCHNIGQTINDGHSGSIDADINAPEAWEITRGVPSIVVAVFDEGVTSNHPDLPNTRQLRLNGSNFGSGNPNDPSPINNANHGNSCAGVIAATMNNNEGIAGIAPNCKIMPLRWDKTSAPEDMADGIDFAVENGANIISCSWGYSSSNSTLHPVIKTAIENAINQNVVVIFAAGNTANHPLSNDGFVTFPANANIADLITVGASDRYDMMAAYSPKSPLIDVVAPSHRAYPSQVTGETFEMWSLDIPGNAGYNPNHYDRIAYVALNEILPSSGTNYLSYTGRFGGTSHSCPVVAGVVALMLSVNPLLSPTDVNNILKTTCDKVGGYTYTNGKCNEMGYGRVNAYEAVVEATGGNEIQRYHYTCDTTKYFLRHTPTTGSTINWTLSNATQTIFHYSIIGASNQDTVLIKYSCNSNIPWIADAEPFAEPPSLRGIYPIVNATITNENSTQTYHRNLGSSTDNFPICTIDSGGAWYVGHTRTFAVINCQNEPDSAFLWTIVINKFLNTTDTLTARGRTLSLTPTFMGDYTISVTNTNSECGYATTTFQTYSVGFKIKMNTVVNNSMLYVTILGGDTINRTIGMEKNNYTIELWHSFYGRLHLLPMQSASAQISTSDLLQGTYVVVLKNNGNIIAQTKVQIW